MHSKSYPQGDYWQDNSEASYSTPSKDMPKLNAAIHEDKAEQKQQPVPHRHSNLVEALSLLHLQCAVPMVISVPC